MSMRRACRVLGMSTSAPYYRPRRPDDAPVIDAVSKHVTDNPGHGFGLLYDSFRADRQPWGKSWLWRVYKQLRLNLPRRGKRRLPARIAQPLDSQSVQTKLGRRTSWRMRYGAAGASVRSTLLMTSTARRCGSRSTPAYRLRGVIRALNELIELRGKPRRLRLDNGPELISRRARAVGPGPSDRAVLHPARQADTERADRTLQSNGADRGPRPLHLQQHERSASDARGLAPSLQPSTSPQRARWGSSRQVRHGTLNLILYF